MIPRSVFARGRKFADCVEHSRNESSKFSTPQKICLCYLEMPFTLEACEKLYLKTTQYVFGTSKVFECEKREFVGFTK